MLRKRLTSRAVIFIDLLYPELLRHFNYRGPSYGVWPTSPIPTPRPARYSPPMPPRPFRIHVPDSVLDDLRDRLDRTRWPDAIPDTGWDYGADVAYVRELCDYWRNEYDWRAQEAALNAWPQFLCEVDGVDIHYWHVRGQGPNPHPLLLTHGWPGSMFEFLQLIGPLTDPAAHGGDPADAFDVVIPSIPGFGWSGKPQERGWGPSRVADALDHLMTAELGYERYGAQGGDWGAIISTRLGATHAGNLSGLHLNMALAGPPDPPTEADEAGLASRRAFQASRDRLQQRPGHEAPVPRHRPGRLTRWHRRLDHGEVPHLERLQRRCRVALLEGHAADQHHVLLGAQQHRERPPASTTRPAPRVSGVASPPASSRIAAPTGFAAFPKEILQTPRHWVEARLQPHPLDGDARRAATSPRWRNRTASSPTFAPSSASRARVRSTAPIASPAGSRPPLWRSLSLWGLGVGDVVTLQRS